MDVRLDAVSGKSYLGAHGILLRRMQSSLDAWGTGPRS